MSQNRHYSPAIGRFLVCALYHEARERSMPMTQLVDELLKGALRGSMGWQKAENQYSIRDSPHQDHAPS